MAGELIIGDLGGSSDEAWIVAANPDVAMRVRNLNTYLQRGGALKEVRLVEGADGGWTMWVRLTSRAGEYRLNIYKSDAPKIYRDVGLAIAACREDFGYFGPITLSTERLRQGGGGAPATEAEIGGDA